MSSITQFEINGVVDTAQPVLENINLLATAAGCFLTWDPDQGKWSVIVNEPDVSVKSFNDSNIIGPIAVSGSGLNELYNSVTIEYPHKDVRDSVDMIDITIDPADRYPQELDNNLNIKMDCINDPIQAQIIASRELKQSRVDKIVRFTTDYTSNELKAGDLIDVTASAYGFSAKVFRIISIEEEDTDEGAIVFSISAREYDPAVYTTSGLTYNTRNKRTGIIPKASNPEVRRSEDVDIGSQVGRLLGANLLLGLLNSNSNPLGGLLRNIFGVDRNTGQIFSRSEFNDPTKQSVVESITSPPVTVTANKTSICTGDNVTFSIQHNCTSCFFSDPTCNYTYTISGVTQDEVNIPLSGPMTTTGTAPSAKTVTFNITGSPGSSKTATFTVGSNSASVQVFAGMPTQYVSNVASNVASVIEGNPITYTVTTVGYTNGSTLSYTLSGTAASKVSSPPLSGTITINNNTATLNVTTTDDAAFNNPQALTLTVGTSVTNPCAVTSNSRTVAVNNNDSTGPQPPTPPPDKTCDYVLVPLVWCGTFDGTTNFLKSVAVRRSVFLPRATSGGTAVPLTVTVANPNTSNAAINVTSTVNVLTGGAGSTVNVITSFDAAPSGGNTLITGTTAAFNGHF